MKKVITFGVFDYFHYGHLKLFENARKLGDHLTVAVQDGDYILRHKPDAKICYTTRQRMELVSALRTVDEAVLYRLVDEDIKLMDFDILAIGGDQTHAGFIRAVEWCASQGREVVRLARTPGISSSSVKDMIMK